MRETEPDEAYEEYVWGEPSPRAFAKRCRLNSGPRTRESRRLVPELADVDLTAAVAR